jgi:hypothetical protein
LSGGSTGVAFDLVGLAIVSAPSIGLNSIGD